MHLVPSLTQVSNISQLLTTSPFYISEQRRSRQPYESQMHKPSKPRPFWQTNYSVYSPHFFYTSQVLPLVVHLVKYALHS